MDELEKRYRMIKKVLWIIFTSLVMLTFLNGCGATKHVPVTDKTDIILRDSVIFRDSTRVIDSIIYVQIPREKVMDIIKQMEIVKEFFCLNNIKLAQLKDF